MTAMAARRKKPAQAEEGEDWLTIYADAITLLLAFFVMIISFSKFDLPVFEEVKASIKQEIGGSSEEETPIFALHTKIQQIVQDTDDIPPEIVDVGFDDEGIVIDFASGAFFKPGSAELTDLAKLLLAGVKRELEVPPYDLFFVDAEGHTDDVPISTPLFPSNWELSAGRAASVVRQFIDDGMEPERLKASGYADTKPKFPVMDLLGEPIPENREKNRRVSVRLHP